MLSKSSFSKSGLFELIVFILVEVALVLVFTIVPDEKVMGAIQRIFYFHVGSAIASYFCFGFVLVASLMYLASRNKIWDSINVAAAEVGFIMCSITLASGMIWARTAWNVWFRWEPRLVTFLLLWLLSAGFVFIRKFGSLERLESHCAVIGILSALTVPAVWLSVHLVPQAVQLHPQVVEKGGLKDVSFVVAMLVSCLALICLSSLLIWLRYNLEELSKRVESL